MLVQILKMLVSKLGESAIKHFLTSILVGFLSNLIAEARFGCHIKIVKAKTTSSLLPSRIYPLFLHKVPMLLQLQNRITCKPIALDDSPSDIILSIN